MIEEDDIQKIIVEPHISQENEFSGKVIEATLLVVLTVDYQTRSGTVHFNSSRGEIWEGLIEELPNGLADRLRAARPSENPAPKNRNARELTDRLARGGD